MSTLIDAFSEHEARFKNHVITTTWGHLFPTESKEGYLTLASTEYKDVVIIKEEIDIEGSPWWFRAVHDFAYKIFSKAKVGTVKRIPISVTIRKYKNGEERIRIKRKPVKRRARLDTK
jgi:hypothetical protein